MSERELIERIYNLLKKEEIQWADSFEGDRHCVFCKGWQYSDGHNKNCELRQILGDVEKYLNAK